MKRRPWTPAEISILRRYYPDERAVDVARRLGRSTSQVHQAAQRHGLRKSAAFNASDLAARIRRGRLSPKMVANRFQKGHTPFNKGLRRPGYSPGRMAETQFKRGCMAGAARRKYVPIGTERITKDGQLQRKVTDDPNIYPARRWVSVARLVWESVNGTIPIGHVVRFKDGMATTAAAEITVDKLECINQSENMRRNSYHRYPQPIPHMIQLRGALNRMIHSRERKADEKQDR